MSGDHVDIHSYTTFINSGVFCGPFLILWQYVCPSKVKGLYLVGQLAILYVISNTTL